MSDNRIHPNTDRLHGLVEDTLDAAARSSVETHVSGCPECRAEVAELRSLFDAFSTLPELAPSHGFADRVMSKVRVRRPAFAGAAAWVERVTPQTTGAWAAAAAVLALPVVGATVLIAWLMSQPGVTAQGLWTLGSGLAGEALTSSWHWMWARFAGTTLAAWLSQAVELVGTIGRGEIGLAVVLFATLTLGSLYVLYQNLFRPEARRSEHASYVF